MMSCFPRRDGTVKNHLNWENMGKRWKKRIIGIILLISNLLIIRVNNINNCAVGYVICYLNFQDEIAQILNDIFLANIVDGPFIFTRICHVKV